MNTKTTLFFASLMAAGLLSGMTGCASNKNGEITAEDLRSDPTPELQSVDLTSEQRKNIWARTINTNLREIPDEIDGILLLDRPVRVNRYPIP